MKLQWTKCLWCSTNVTLVQIINTRQFVWLTCYHINTSIFPALSSVGCLPNWTFLEHFLGWIEWLSIVYPNSSDDNFWNNYQFLCSDSREHCWCKLIVVKRSVDSRLVTLSCDMDQLCQGRMYLFLVRGQHTAPCRAVTNNHLTPHSIPIITASTITNFRERTNL